MKILWTKPILPFPPNQGTKRVTLQVLKNLASEHEIVLFTRLLEKKEQEQVHLLEEEIPNLRVVAELAPNRRSFLHRVLYGIGTRFRGCWGVPPIESYTTPPQLVHRFQDLIRRESPDLVVAEYWYSQEYLRGVTVPSVLFAHDIEFHVREMAGRISRESGRAGRWGALEVRRERSALLEARQVWVLTDKDKSLAESIGCDEKKISILPYGLDLADGLKPRDAKDPKPRKNSVLLFGAFQADFNQDALRFTLDSIWPELLRLKPEAVLHVGGSGLDDSLRRLCERARVRVEGEVSSVRRALLASEVVLIPLRYGGGLRIRLLESLALECTVVGTPAGVLGMGAEAEKDVLVGETPQELAGQIARALDDPGLREDLGAHGREAVVARHDMETSARIQRSLVRAARH